MEQKRVLFKVAKAIKEAGYPQTISSVSSEWYLPDGQSYTSYIDATIPLREFHEVKAVCIAPTYLDVWLWLWKEKKFFIKTHVIYKEFNFQILEYQEDGWKSYGIVSSQSYHNPEEAIIAAIEYLVDNDLIK